MPSQREKSEELAEHNYSLILIRDLQDGIFVTSEYELCTVVVDVSGNGIWQTTRWVHIAIKHVDQSVPGLCASESRPYHCGDIRMFDPRFDVDLANGMHNHDCVLVLPRDSGYKCIAIIPCRQISAIALVAIKFNVPLSRVGIDEDQRNVCLNGQVSSGFYVKVVEEPVDGGSVLPCTALDCLKWLSALSALVYITRSGDTHRYEVRELHKNRSAERPAASNRAVHWLCPNPNPWQEFRYCLRHSRIDLDPLAVAQRRDL